MNDLSAGDNPMRITASDVAVFGNTDLWLANNDNAASQIRFFEANGSTGNFPAGTNYTSFEAGAQAGNINYILPTTAPTVGQILSASSVVGSTVTLTWVADDIGLLENREDDGDTPTSIAAPIDEDAVTLPQLLKIIEAQNAEIKALKKRLDAVAPEGDSVEGDLTLEGAAD